MGCSGGCGKCKVCQGSPACRVANSSRYRRGLCSTGGPLPPFATRNEDMTPLPYGGCSGKGQSSGAAIIDAVEAIESTGTRVDLWGALEAVCPGIRKACGEAGLNGVPHEKITKDIERYLGKQAEETWVEFLGRLLGGGG